MMFIHNVHDVFFVHKALARARQSNNIWPPLVNHFQKCLPRPRIFNVPKRMRRVGGRVVVVDKLK